MPLYEVKIYYSGFNTFIIESENADDAILIAREKELKVNEIISSLSNWEEADEAVELKNYKNASPEVKT